MPDVGRISHDSGKRPETGGVNAEKVAAHNVSLRDGAVGECSGSISHGVVVDVDAGNHPTRLDHPQKPEGTDSSPQEAAPTEAGVEDSSRPTGESPVDQHPREWLGRVPRTDSLAVGFRRGGHQWCRVGTCSMPLAYGHPETVSLRPPKAADCCAFSKARRIPGGLSAQIGRKRAQGRGAFKWRSRRRAVLAVVVSLINP